MRTHAPAFRVHRGRLAGFTLVELITVLAVLAVLAGIALPRFFDRSVFDARGYADELAGALRHARAVAVGSGCRVRFEVLAGTYTAHQQPASAGHCDAASSSYTTAVLAPDGRAVAGAAPSGITASPVLTVVFDGEGRASSGGDTDVSVGIHTLRVEASSGLVRGP